MGCLALAISTVDDDRIPGTPAADMIRTRDCSPGKSPEMAQIRSWLASCKKFHAGRCPEDVEQQMPTRVIDVGDPDKGEAPRLIITSPSTKGRYMALSYCWGPATDNFCLNATTMSDLLRGVEETVLTTTHREAMALARELDLRYIWIDALCIIQGDAADWERESVSMGSVYGNAALTLTAARSDDARDGFRTNGTARLLCDIPYGGATGEPGSVFIGMERIATRAARHVGIRGWCLQEKILSRRTLTFGTDMLLFDCIGGAFTEESIKLEAGLSSTFYRVLTNASGLAPEEHARQAINLWSFVILTFTPRQLSNPHDIFAAVSSIAIALATILPSRYLAGLWESELPLQLMWDTAPEVKKGGVGKTSSRPLPTRFAPAPVVRAPSWSWASVQGRSTWHLAGQERRQKRYQGSQYFKARPTTRYAGRWTSDNQCDSAKVRIPSRTLWLRGRVAQAAVFSLPPLHQTDPKAWFLGTPGYKCYFVRLEEGKTVGGDTMPTDVQVIGKFDVKDERTATVWCLELVADGGLLLVQADEDDSFRRVGLFRSNREEWFDEVEERDIRLV